MCFISSNNKRGAHVNQNKKPIKKTVSLHPGQEKDPLPKAETVSYVCNASDVFMTVDSNLNMFSLSFPGPKWH